MSGRVFTVEDLLRMIQIVKKEMQYLETLREKWEAQKTRFPLIYEGIVKQQEALKLRAGKLRQMKVVVEMADLEGLPTQLMEEGATPATDLKESPNSESAKPESAETEAKAEPKTQKPTPAVKEPRNSAATKIKATKTTPRRRLGIKT